MTDAEYMLRVEEVVAKYLDGALTQDEAISMIVLISEDRKATKG